MTTSNPLNRKTAARTNRMTTGIERVFRQISRPGDVPVLYREVILHFIHFLDKEGNKVSSKLDKTMLGQIYREASRPGESSPYGSIEYTFPDGNTRLLLAIPKS